MDRGTVGTFGSYNSSSGHHTAMVCSSFYLETESVTHFCERRSSMASQEQWALMVYREVALYGIGGN